MVATMDITFLGTGSAQPSPTRNHQSMAFRTDGDIWLFDCGEATQHQLQKSKLKMGKISRIFITHMHGDHCFGLAPVMCSLSDSFLTKNTMTTEPIEIYGPTPLRSWLRTTFKSTYSRLSRTYRVHELLLHDDPVENNENLHENELPGQNLRMINGRFDLPLYTNNKGYKVLAVPIQHSIPSLGFVIQEPESPGKVNDLIPQLRKNMEALQLSGIANPMTILGQIQTTNQPYLLPDGNYLKPPPPRPGREVVILGDTKDPSAIIPFCNKPTLLVHESTNALTSLDKPTKKDAPLMTWEEVTTKTLEHGHSTPKMAAAFAQKIGCNTLILTHFSSRYKGDESAESMAVMEEIRSTAVDGFDNRDKDVFCARDLWTYEIK
ncbi:beta-lactamase-like protein [Pilobolus umbonatus]|nr:beta-lactamase-like protein [Pilobolus umbonatus]